MNSSQRPSFVPAPFFIENQEAGASLDSRSKGLAAGHRHNQKDHQVDDVHVDQKSPDLVWLRSIGLRRALKSGIRTRSTGTKGFEIVS